MAAPYLREIAECEFKAGFVRVRPPGVVKIGVNLITTHEIPNCLVRSDTRLFEAFAFWCAESQAWPLPGQGWTWERWARLSALAESDLVLARLVEAHVDALAICRELDFSMAVAADTRWGVWAAEAPGAAVNATKVSGGWRVDGTKAWCSGATLLTHALVTARGGEQRLLFAVDLAQESVQVEPDSWAAAGMKRADTRTVHFDGTKAELIGSDGSYLARPGFWTGAMGVAACWYGGGAALGRTLRMGVAQRPGDPHAAAHLGATDVALGNASACLAFAALAVDDEPDADHRRLALRVRGSVASAVSEVATRVGRALGPSPYATDMNHAQRVADLEVYVRQDHAERDLAVLGTDVAAAEWDWSL